MWTEMLKRSVVRLATLSIKLDKIPDDLLLNSYSIKYNIVWELSEVNENQVLRVFSHYEAPVKETEFTNMKMLHGSLLKFGV